MLKIKAVDISIKSGDKHNRKTEKQVNMSVFCEGSGWWTPSNYGKNPKYLLKKVFEDLCTK